MEPLGLPGHIGFNYNSILSTVTPLLHPPTIRSLERQSSFDPAVFSLTAGIFGNQPNTPPTGNRAISKTKQHPAFKIANTHLVPEDGGRPPPKRRTQSNIHFLLGSGYYGSRL